MGRWREFLRCACGMIEICHFPDPDVVAAVDEFLPFLVALLQQGGKIPHI